MLAHRAHAPPLSVALYPNLTQKMYGYLGK
jgi:hypothetical protein